MGLMQDAVNLLPQPVDSCSILYPPAHLHLRLPQLACRSYDMKLSAPTGLAQRKQSAQENTACLQIEAFITLSIAAFGPAAPHPTRAGATNRLNLA